jgi:hypothetical protein
MRGLIAAVCLAALGVAGEARAGDYRRLTVELDWKHVPRESGPDAPRTSQRAFVRGAVVRYQRYRDGLRLFGIEYDDGTWCTTTADKDATASLTCGSRTGYYSLLQLPGEQTKLEWVFDADSKPAAETPESEAPKAKVKL